jgi:hypothetical protein
MNNFEQFTNMMNRFLEKNGYQMDITTSIRKASYNSEDKVSLCNSEMTVIDMDEFARYGYRKIIIPQSNTEDKDTINTVDAFLINCENEWYLVEFKDAKLGNSIKTSVLKKAYSNLYAIFDILYDMRDTDDGYTEFNYNAPTEFVRNHVSYILVFSASKNKSHIVQEKNHRLKGESYVPEFMRRLPKYIFRNACAMSELNFEKDFLKGFRY